MTSLLDELTDLYERSTFVIVMGFTYQDARAWARKHGSQRRTYAYPLNVEYLYGLKDCRIVLLESAEASMYYPEVLHHAKMLEAQGRATLELGSK